MLHLNYFFQKCQSRPIELTQAIEQMLINCTADYNARLNAIEDSLKKICELL